LVLNSSQKKVYLPLIINFLVCIYKQVANKVSVNFINVSLVLLIFKRIDTKVIF